MSVVAVYNMKGGVGKTTTAVNLSYFAAAAGLRVLLWDLDPQAASTFAFRVRPRVAGFGRKSLESGEALAAAIKQTDYDNLDLLPADFGYRKLDRLLGHFGNPARVVTALLDTLDREYDAVFLDCPAGFSLLTEGVFAAADAVLVPTIPTVLSLRTIVRVIKWADQSGSPSELAAFFSMVDRHKTLHRRACDWSAGHPEAFLTGQIPYASVVEQMTLRRMPLAMFAPRDSATTAFAGIWAELQTRLQQRREGGPQQRDRWGLLLQALESLIVRLESAGGQEGSQAEDAKSNPGAGPAVEVDSPGGGDVHFVHSFDIEGRDLQRCGYVLELHERKGGLHVVAARSGSDDDEADTSQRAEIQIDNRWAMEILSGAMSPLAALERRLGTPKLSVVENVIAIVGGRRLQRIGSRVAQHDGAGSREAQDPKWRADAQKMGGSRDGRSYSREAEKHRGAGRREHDAGAGLRELS
jgi:chromosome partitioning protein